eukprot:GFUD01033252.1.p1 GENE.GFUD01033252.1~~GFUD01033252.1.p1  ORF type:complete len:379 (-),score=103.23 GFUD01033252.1:121-1257(-)
MMSWSRSIQLWKPHKYAVGAVGLCITKSPPLTSSNRASLTNNPATMLLEREAAYNNWKKSFQEIQEKELNCERFTRLSTSVADSDSNISLNRYYNVIAYDHSRVILHHDDKEVYINANIVRVPQANREYILTQGPLEKTVDDFWLMVFQQNSSTVVMLCNCIEMNRDKSWQYWPLEVGHTMVLGESRDGVGLEVTMVHSENKGHFIVRTFTLTDTVSGVKRKIKHFHYVDWPDFNVPESPDHFLEFLLEVRQSGCFLEPSGPPVVHCSAGIGRSGTLILVDSCLVLAGMGEELSLSMVVETLMNTRTYRMGLIQTEDQLRFSVDAIVQGIKQLGLEQGEKKAVGGQHVNGKRLKEHDVGEGEERENQASAKKRKNSQS